MKVSENIKYCINFQNTVSIFLFANVNFWAYRFEWSQLYSADAFLPGISGFQESGPCHWWLLELGVTAHASLGNFLPLAHLTPRTFLHEIACELWYIYYIIKLFSHFKGIIGVGSNIHRPDLQNMFFDCSILFHTVAFSHFWCDLCCVCIWLCFTAEMLCLAAYLSSSLQEPGFSAL